GPTGARAAGYYARALAHLPRSVGETARQAQERRNPIQDSGAGFERPARGRAGRARHPPETVRNIDMTIRTCTLISIGCLLAAAVAAAQGVAPVPPQPPAAPVVPAPVPVPDPAPRFGADSMDWSGIALEAQQKAQEKPMEAQERMALAQEDMQQRIQEEMAPLQEDFQLRSEDMLKETQIRLGNLDLLAQGGPMA